MAIITWRETLTVSRVSTSSVQPSSGRTSCIPAPNRITLPSCYFYPGLILKFTIGGLFNVANTANVDPSTRFELCMGVNGATVIFDTGTISLVNPGATRIGRPFKLEIDLVCRTVGINTGTRFFPTATLQSENLVGSPAFTSGGNTSLIVPVGVPELTAGTDNTFASILDVFCTMKGNNAGMQVDNYRVEALN